MLIEHSFVTTFEAGETLDRVVDTVERLGFLVETRSASHVTARRGRQNPARARSANELPQVLKVEFGRGRVDMAVAIEPRHKPRQIHADLLLGLSRVLESRLAQRLPAAEALAQLSDVNLRIAGDVMHRKVGTWIIVTVLLLILASCILFVWLNV